MSRRELPAITESFLFFISNVYIGGAKVRPDDAPNAGGEDWRELWALDLRIQ
jgi:hypothetical protein